MNIAHKSDVGRTRSINEDRSAVQVQQDGLTIAVVADGMGGHQAGDIASQLAIEVIEEQLQSLHTGLSGEQISTKLEAAIRTANQVIYRSSLEHQQHHGMGTTVVVVIATNSNVYVSHIGDSRAYKITDAKLEQLTEDHSLVNELIKRGQLLPEEAVIHPRRNVLTQALGTEEEIKIETKCIEWKENDMLLLCSDGLSSMVDMKLITSILQSNMQLEEKVDELIQRALDAGGEDNVTVVLLDNTQLAKQEGGEA